MIFRVGTPRSLTAAGVLGIGALAFLLLPWSPAPAPVAAQPGPERKKENEFRDKEKVEKKIEFKLKFDRGGGVPQVRAAGCSTVWGHQAGGARARPPALDVLRGRGPQPARSPARG